MNNTIKARLNELIIDLKLSKNEFAREIDVSSAMISKITTKDINFGVDVYKKIISRFPNLNQQWLLIGIGEMWLNEEKTRNEETLIIENTTTEQRKLTISQSRTLFNNNDRVIRYLEGLTDELSGLYETIGAFVVFQDVAKEITEAYFEPLDDIVFDEGKYFSGNKYNIEQCKKDAYEELSKLKPFGSALGSLNLAIHKFYKEFGKVDDKNVIANSIGPHVL